MSDIIRVAVAGACGKMGSETVKAVNGAPDMEIMGACDVAFAGKSLGEVIGLQELAGVTVCCSVSELFQTVKPDVIVDFTAPSSVMANVRVALENGVRPVIGTTGLTQDNLSEIAGLAESKGMGAVVAPNFAIGAILMMKFASEAAKYMEWVEVTELHHEKKLDAPSGTAIKTTEMIAEARKAAGIEPKEAPGEEELARGAKFNGVHVHSIRMPGLVAHQEVVFGGLGQTLTIRHDSIDRTSFMPGVLLAIRRIMSTRGLVYGLDKLI